MHQRRRPAIRCTLGLVIVTTGLLWGTPNGASAAATLLQSFTSPVTQGSRLLDDWQLEDAMAASAHVLMRNPNNFDARVLAAEVMHQRGQHQEALALLGPNPNAPQGNNPRLANFLPQLRGSAQYSATFKTLGTRHFRIRYQDKDEIMAHYAQEVLEAAYQRIGSDLDAHVSEGDEPITVEIYPSVKGLAQATGLTEQEIETSGTIAVCKFHRLMVISALATWSGYAWADTLAHELTHLMISKSSHNNVPIWLHEGIAKYYETRWRDNAGEGLTPYAETLLGKATKSNSLIPFARMHPSMAKLPNQHDAALAFAEVFAMIEMLVAEHGPGVMARALRELGSGVPFDVVVKRTFGGTLTELERKLHRTLAKRRFRTTYAEAAPLHLGPMGPTRAAAAVLSDGADIEDKEAKTLLRLAELLALQGHDAEAIHPLQRAYRRVGVRLPKLGLRLARALEAGQDHAGAERVVAQTLAIHKDLIEAQKLYAELLLRRGQPKQAALHLRAYCLYNPFDASVHALWAEALEAQGDGPTAARERHFATLATAPRQVQPQPAPRTGASTLRAITEPWGALQIDGSTDVLMTPAWDVPIAPGQHTLRATAHRKNKTLLAQGRCNVPAGQSTVWRAQLQPAE